MPHNLIFLYETLMFKSHAASKLRDDCIKRRWANQAGVVGFSEIFH